MPSPGDLPNPGIQPISPALQADSLPLTNQGSPDGRILNYDNLLLSNLGCPRSGAAAKSARLPRRKSGWEELPHV